MIRLPLLFAAAAALASADTIITVDVDDTTSFLDGSSLTAGTTYYAAFELIGGDASDSTAFISAMNLGGGSALPLNPLDTFGAFTIGPDSSAAAAAFQNLGTLLLAATPGNSYSQYLQQFVAGS